MFRRNFQETHSLNKIIEKSPWKGDYSYQRIFILVANLYTNIILYSIFIKNLLQLSLEYINQ